MSTDRIDGKRGSSSASRKPTPQARPKPVAPKQAPQRRDRAALSGAGGKLDITEGSYRLMDHYRDPGVALATIITARGGDPGQKVGAEERVKAQLEIKRALGLRDMPTSEQLRDMDHWINAYMAVRVDALAPKKGDGFAKQTAKTLGREALGVGAASVTVGYSAAKWAAQSLGVDLIGAVPGQDFKGAGQNVSKPSLKEAWHGLRGVFHGVFDTKSRYQG